MLQFLPIAMMAASTLMQAANQRKGAAQTQAERAQLQAMANRDRLLQAYTNPDDVITQNMMAQEEKQLNASIQQQLSNLLSANRRAQLMGRQTYFNPERQDESISTFLSDKADENYNTARSNALQRILQAAQSYGGSATGYGDMVQNQQARNVAKAQSGPALMGAGANAISMLMNAYGGGGGMGGGMGASGGSMGNIFSSLQSGGGAGSGVYQF